MLVDVVSKNGNLLLSVPLRGDGTPDPTELRIVKEIGHWMKINSESIYDTRPWVVYGEGPTAESANPINAQGFNEGRQHFSAADIRFVKKGDKVVYVTLFGVPEDDFTVKALGSKTEQNKRKIKSITLLGSDEKVVWTQTKESLAIGKPVSVPSPEAVVYKVVLK
jgi:alpha-L-fucosidase